MYKQLAISFFFVLVIAITFYVIKRMLHTKGSAVPKKKIALTVVFICYLSGVAALTIVPLRESRTTNLTTHFNFKPVIKSYQRYLDINRVNDPDATANFQHNFFGNILMFIPLGIFLPWLYNKRLGNTVLLALLCSSLIEFIQFLNMYLGYYRYVDVDDVLLNTFGAIIGYALYKVFLNAGKHTGVQGN
jgi:glycopeptide antibiotics resistance protein